MEVDNADIKESEKVSFFIPTTPFKCTPAATEFNFISAGFNNFLSTGPSDNSQKKDEEVSGVTKGRSEFLSRYSDGYSKSASVAPSTPMKSNPRKKQCGSLDLNERPLKKPRMRKHTPKIFDESKPKKTPKPKIKPLIPKSSNSKAKAKIKKKLEKDRDKVSDDLSEDVDMQTPNSKIPETIHESLVLQVSTPEPKIREHAIPAISPPDLEHDIRTDLGHVSKSCKRSIPFNLENENDVFSVGAAEVIRNHVAHSYNKFLTNPMDSVSEQAVDTNSSTGLEDNLEEAESTSQPNQGNDPSIYQDDQRTCQHHFLKVYERRKTKIDLMPLAGNEAHIYQNNHGTIGSTSCGDHFLKVYKRRTIVNTGVLSLAGNDTISQNDHKVRDKGGSQLDFLENYRTENIIGTADYADKGWNALDTNTKCKVTSSAKRMGRRKGKKRATKKRVKIASRDKKSCFKISKRITRRNFGKILPNENQIAAAMADPESFECVFSLSPMLKSRRKRSIHPKRTKSVFREENTELEPVSLALTLSPLVPSKRKRSKNCKGSTAILDSLCLKSEISEINGIESFIAKWSQISAWNETQECSQHEDSWPQTDKSACNDIQECPRHEDLLPRTNKSTCSESQECPQHDSLCLKSEISAINGIESFVDKWSRISAWNEIQECSQHEDSWPQTDKSACNGIQECPRHEDLLPRTNKSTCSESQECPHHENLHPRTKCSTNLESLVAKLIQGFEKIKICGKRTYKKKTTSNNAGQLVLHNPSGAIIALKKKYKPRETLPRVDLDMETLRVWKQLIENGGIDEDPDKEKNIWWENQREIFKGRVSSFIARMRLVLGNRTFSQWKGSVVDSVVGVFLTQNVSDHLSSNAFMLLASAFPLQNKQDMTTQQEQALAITQGMQDSFEKDEKDFDTCESSSRNTSECLQEENIGNEITCGNQSSVNSCNPEVKTFAKSCDLGNEIGNLPDTISKKKNKSPKREIDWNEMKKTYSTGKYSGSTDNNRDSVNWEAVRHADVEHIFEPIKSRGQGNVLAAKIKNFLNRLVKHHGSIDLEWLRDVPTNDVEEFLLSIDGLGPKSVDCIRLLSLRHHSFPVDINVARVAVRLGWVPLQPLPDGVLMHLLDAFPLQSEIQKYLWPRLCKLDMLTLYELHYHMITFGKVFCTKKKPNCDACPLRAECRHFASAFASTRFRLPGPQQKGGATSKQPDRVVDVSNMCVPSPNLSHCSESFLESSFKTQVCEPIIEMPESPEHRPLEQDIEDFPYGAEHEQEIPTIKLNTKAFGENILNFIDKSNKEFKENMLSFVDEISKLHRDEEVSNALVLLNPKSASRPACKLKTEGRLRTEHSVYELPDDHPLLSGFEKREADDPCPYLLAISLTEQVMYKQKKKGKVSSSKELELYDSDSTSYSPNDQIVYGTILIPCRTANRGSFPLNGTYFQVNEVFADHETSLNPTPVARASIWNLTRRALYCGTTVSTIFKGLSTKDIQYCFWKGFMAIRGYDRKQRAPRPLHNRFHSNE